MVMRCDEEENNLKHLEITQNQMQNVCNIRKDKPFDKIDTLCEHNAIIKLYRTKHAPSISLADIGT